MTCIVALIDEKGVAHIAGDSLMVAVPSQFHSRVSQTVTREPKIFRKGNMLFGANGSVRMIQILRYLFEIPEYTPGRPKVEYLVGDFLKAFQACLRQENLEGELGGNILLAWEGELFTIEENFQVTYTADSYDAVGKSSEVATGSLYTTARLTLPPQERLILALEAAEHHTCVVKAPYMYLSGEMDQAEILPG